MKDQDETQQEAIRTLAKMTSMHTNYPGGSNAVDQYAAKQQEDKIRQALDEGDIDARGQKSQKPLLSFLWLLTRLVLMVSAVYLLINFFSQL